MMSRWVSFTFDDALEEHLDAAMPVLERSGLRGTFFVPAGSPAFLRRVDDWRAAAARGHELGNHSIFHPAVSSKPYVTAGVSLENYTLDRMRVELETANRILASLDGRAERAYAYPCCNSILGRPGWLKRFVRRAGLGRTRVAGWINRLRGLDVFSTEEDYAGVVAGLFVAARSGGERFAADAEFPPPRFAVPCVAGDGRQGREMKAVLDDFRRHDQGWLVFMFHGVGGGHRLSCGVDALEEVVRAAASDKTLRVVPFIEAAKGIWSRP
ncbi:MAG TPA: polysaccharide deacetylase family protein [Candidatus Brocadiia bacterium]|nr:polysaccharide deacetylase family protein [Candidatus Brocadiia bacterium]